MRILLDMLGCQTASRHRGIGRYALNFTKSLARQSPSDELFLIGRNHPQESVLNLKSELHGFIQPQRFKTISLPGCDDYFEIPGATLSSRMQQSLLARAYARFSADVIHINSFFEWEVSHPDVAHIDSPVRSVFLYDLIPLIFPKKYLTDSNFAACYRTKIEAFKKFDIYLSDSESARKDAIRLLKIPDEKIITVLSGCDPVFNSAPLTDDERDSIVTKFNLRKPFLLYTGNQDYRKNLEGTIKGYAAVPSELRNKHPLVIVAPLDKQEQAHLWQIAKQAGLSPNTLTLLERVTDTELVLLYKACHLFIFPSLYEGFGLPALEAMSCGAPVIGANNSSIPEVIGRKDALFDASSSNSIAGKISEVLKDTRFHAALRGWSSKRAACFSWSITADKARKAWENACTAKANVAPRYSKQRKRVAIVTPLPPEQSGIADYAVDVCLELQKYFDIEFFTTCAEPVLSDNFRKSAVNPIEKFPEFADSFDTIVYQVGNSPFHWQMFKYMKQWPGITVLHDFYLCSVMNWMRSQNIEPNLYIKNLLACEGPSAVAKALDPLHFSHASPSNSIIFDHSKCVIVHSRHAVELIKTFYPEGTHCPVRMIPLIKQCHPPSDLRRKTGARSLLDIDETHFVVASFGHVAQPKYPDLLLSAFELYLKKSGDKKTRLVFVGQLEGGQAGEDFQKKINQSPCKNQIMITGYLEAEGYAAWLQTADAAIQLRKITRGETSAAALDCMSHGLPLIVNQFGSFSELPKDAVKFVSEKPTITELADAITEVRNNQDLRKRMAEKSLEWIARNHNPAHVGELYRDVIEQFKNANPLLAPAAFANYLAPQASEVERTDFFIRHTIPTLPVLRKPRFYFDITQFKDEWNRNHVTGIQRVIANLYDGFNKQGLNLWPIELDANSNHLLALYQDATGKFCQTGIPVNLQQGDTYILPELRGNHSINQPFWHRLQDAGVAIHAIVYDMLPIRMPQYFPDFVPPSHLNFVDCIVKYASGIHCISKAVADDLTEWIKTNKTPTEIAPNQKITHFYLGSDIEKKSPDMQKNYSISSFFGKEPTFLMVGTIEPRKGHNFTLDAFEKMWAAGWQGRLLVIGKKGWSDDGFIERARKHPQIGKKLEMLETADDNMLAYCYKKSTALIAASAGEGFGLPLVEAAHYNLPILAADIPVFREVCQKGALYFSRQSPENLIDCIQAYFNNEKRSKDIPLSSALMSLSWNESAIKFHASLTN